MKPPRARGVKALVARFRIPIILLLIAAVAVGLWVRQESQRDAVLSGGSVDRSIGVTRRRPAPRKRPLASHRRWRRSAGPGSTSSNARSRNRSRPRSRSTPAVRSIGSTTPPGGPPDGEAIVQDSFSALRSGHRSAVRLRRTDRRTADPRPRSTCPTVTTATAGHRCWSRGRTRRRSVISSVTSPGRPVPTW